MIQTMTEANITFLRSYGFGIALVLLLAFMSELQVGLSFDPPLGLKYPWAIVCEYLVIAKELYTERYASLLP